MTRNSARVFVATLALAACQPTGDEPPTPSKGESGDSETDAATGETESSSSESDGESEESSDASTDESDTGSESSDTSTEEDTEGTETDTDTGCLEGELGCACEDDVDCADGLACVDALCVEPQCGDGIVTGDEACDDGNLMDSDGCNADCTETKVVALDAGGEHTCALLNSGDVKCWGRANYGQLGQGTDSIIGDGETPASVPVIQLGAKATAVATGQYHTCALLDGGEVTCWGLGSGGRLGYGNTETIGDDELPVDAGPVNVGGPVTQIALGDYHSCAVLETGYVTCWGSGDGCVNNIGDNETPASVQVLDLGSTVERIVAGGTHTCACLTNDALKCWGRNNYGKLGITVGTSTVCTTNNIDLTVPLPPVGEFDGGGEHSCAITDQTGLLTCWGYASQGALGYGDTQHIGGFNFPVTNYGLDLPEAVLDVATGESHTCAILESGSIMCWGNGYYGVLGYGNTTNIGDNEIPEGLVDIGGPAKIIVAGYSHTCALREDDEVVCWGRSNFGQLGYGSPSDIGDDELPVDVGTVQVF